jgi:hypothetical protein
MGAGFFIDAGGIGTGFAAGGGTITGFAASPGVTSWVKNSFGFFTSGAGRK